MKKSFLVFLAVLVLVVTQIILAATVTITGANDTVNINDKAYVVQNNVWGASTSQTLSVDNATGAFTVTQSGHNNSTSGSPASYPSIFKGSHWGNVTTNSGMPIMVSNISSVNSNWNITLGTGSYDCAYDIWFNTTSTTSGQPDGAELMIWINHQGPPQPAGSKVATVTIAGTSWDVWFSQIGWKYVAYVRTTPTTSVNFDINDFIKDCVSRGYIQNSWYLIDVEAGFELWQSGVGCASNSFAVTVNGGGSNPTPTPTGTVTPTPTPTPSSTSYLVSYAIQNDWGSGATIGVTIKNNSAAPLSNWTLTWNFPGNQKVTNLWNGTYTQNGSAITVKNSSYNGDIQAGGTASFGFNISYSGSNAKPTSFTLNGTPTQVQ